MNGKDSDGGICYELVLEHYQHNNINYISIDNGK
jgi:hypothetical protein